jgi:hypothetical protein
MIKEYYRGSFRADLASFFAGGRVPYFGHAWPHNCSRQLTRVPADHRDAFILCLYFTVLVDQAMHAHFRGQYRQFESLTRYPKFCHGLGQFHLNPRGILLAPVEQNIVSQQAVMELIPDAMALFVDEVVDFFQTHMPQITPTEFFLALVHDPDVQIPLLVRTLNSEPSDDVIYAAYDALRDASERI